MRVVRPSSTGVPLLAYGGGFGVLIHGLIGLAVALSPAKQATACGLLVLAWSGSVLTLYRALRIDSSVRKPLGWCRLKVAPTLAILALFIVGCVGLTRLQVTFPPALPGNIFPLQEHTLPVKVQLLMGSYPVDNYIPFVAEEFLARDISFVREHPLVPGQEVSSRPILLALAVLPFRTALNPPPRQSGTLPRFNYCGVEYPDTGLFVEGPGYREFLDVSIALNALVLLGAALLFFARLPVVYAVVGLVLLATTPFYLWETIYAWPKLLAAFYLLLALDAFTQEQNPASVALWGGLAYWSHPYALVFLLSFGCHYALSTLTRRRRDDFIVLARYGTVAVLMLAPWFLWTHLFLHRSSDLISQNLATREAKSVFSHLWSRLANLYGVFSPRMFGIEPFNLEAVFQSLIYCLPGVLGLLVVPAYAGCVTRLRTDRLLLVYGVFLPALLMLLPFSEGTLIMLMGYHSIGVCLLLVGLLVLAAARRALGLTLIGVQIFLQLTMLVAHARTMGATFSTHGVVYQMLAHRPEVQDARRQVVLHEGVEANGVTIASLWAEPPTSFVYRNIRLPAGRVHFRCQVTIHPLVWSVPTSDGAEFTLEVRRHGQDGSRQPVWTTMLDPAHHPDQHRWQPVDVDLSAFAGKTVDLALKAGTGPANNGIADWCVWGDPELVVE